MAVMPTVHYNRLCASAAEAILADVDLDAGLAALLGR